MDGLPGQSILNKNKIFEVSARYIWPIVRPFVRKSNRCQQCIVSEKYTVLTNGICQECLTVKAGGRSGQLPLAPDALRAFQAIISAATTGEGYHAVLLFSGGKDSAYILDRVTREFPDLRILCVTVDNGFMSPLAIRNVSYLTRKLNVDLLVVNSHIKEFVGLFRRAFLDLKGRGSYGVVDKADGDFIFAIGRAIAAEMRIPLMLAGLSWVQLEKIFGTTDFRMRQREEVLSVFPLAVWRTDEQEIRSVVRASRLMLPGSDSPIVSNSSMILTMSVIDVLNNGYSSFEPEFAQLVREGKTDRRTWLHIFELLEFVVNKGLLTKDLKQGLAELDLDIASVLGPKP